VFDLSDAWISPHYRHDQIDLETASIDDRIALFEDRIRGYITTPCRLLVNSYENSTFLIILAVFSCVELIEVLNRGVSSRYKSQEFFKSGFRRVYKIQRPKHLSAKLFETRMEAILDDFYVQVRCGLMHVAATRSKVIWSKELKAPIAIKYDEVEDHVDAIVINPARCLLNLDVYVSEFCRDLRSNNNAELRNRFDQGWKALRSEG
jgi:hypothetical protein